LSLNLLILPVHPWVSIPDSRRGLDLRQNSPKPSQALLRPGS
jgi:hypothetical protein